jgi:hypothetical protein
MELLAKHIREQLAQKDCCTVFRPEVARVWPQLTEMIEKRNAAIHAFAAERGWEAKIVDPGIVVTFRKRKAAHQPLESTAEKQSASPA